MSAWIQTRARALALAAFLCFAPAAAGAAPVQLAVTGHPASAAFLRARILAAAEREIAQSVPPGTPVRAALTLPATEPLDSGFLTTFTVPVSVGGGPAPAQTTVDVDVRNVALPDEPPLRLAFADDPERIVAAGVLSRTTVAVGRPTRIYYYHENKGAPRRFCVVLSANDSVITHVQIVGASGGPNIDVMSVGDAVTRSFLASQPLDEGVIAEIDGGKPLLERDELIGPGDGVVGALDLHVLDGGPVTATVLAIPPAAEPRDYLYGVKLPDDGHARHGTFDLAGASQRVVGYTAGGPDATFVYGTRRRTLPNVDAADPGHDYGDYGVLQHVTFDLANPGPAPATLYLYEKPLGGDVRSSFLVNAQLVELGCVRVARPYRIAGETLAAHATGVFDVLTMTDGGSNYPLEIGVTTTPPLPTTPAINAADGCFPKPGGPPAAPQPARGPAGH